MDPPAASLVAILVPSPLGSGSSALVGVAISASLFSDFRNRVGGSMSFYKHQRLPEIALVVCAPLALAVVELFHPHPDDLLKRTCRLGLRCITSKCCSSLFRQ